MNRVSIVRVRQNCCEQWDMGSMPKYGLAPLLGDHLVQFEAMQGQAVVPVRQMAVWASAFRQLSKKTDKHVNVSIMDAPASLITLWDTDIAIFFMDACNAVDTVRLANDCVSRNTRTIIASGAADIYRCHIHNVSPKIEWCSLDVTEVASILSVPADGLDVETLIPAWDATFFGDYCPYFVPVSLARSNGSPRETQEILDEIRSLKKLGILKPEKRLLFDSPFEDEQQCASLLLSVAKGLVTEEMLWAAWLPGCLDVRDIAQLRRSGMGLACLGSSMSFHGLMHDGCMRRITANQVRDLKTRGIVVVADCIVSDIQDVDIMAIIRAGVDIPNIILETPYPETVAFQQMNAAGQITSYDWSLYDGLHLVFRPIQKNAHQIEQRLRLCRFNMVSGLRIFYRMIRPSMQQISMWYHSVFSFSEATALRMALAFSVRRLFSAQTQMCISLVGE